MTSYTIDWDGRRALLPPVGKAGSLVEVSSWHDAEDALNTFCRHALAGASKRKQRPVAAQVELIHRPDNDYNPSAVSVAMPSFFGGDQAARHMGYLGDYYLRRVGMSLLPDLAAFARRHGNGGTTPIVCTAVVLDTNELALDLPNGDVLGKAIEAFLVADAPQYVPAIRPPWGRRPGRLIPNGDHRHTQTVAETTQALAWVGCFATPHRPVANLSIALTHQRPGRPRSLRLREATTGRGVGTVVMDYLFLDDERDRPDVLPLLAEAGIPVAQPIPLGDTTDRVPFADSAPNMWTYWFPEGLDLRPRDPQTTNSWMSLAHYNPTTKVLWVEDSRLVDPAQVYAARVGLKVARVGLPTVPWALQREIPYYELKDQALRSASRETVFEVHLLASVRDLVPTDLFSANTITWTTSPTQPPHNEPDELFRRHERYAQHRERLFVQHELSDVIDSCRLCGAPGMRFSTPICASPLTYCYACLHHAAGGTGNDRKKAAKALRLLGDLEFENTPMLEGQLDTLHVNPDLPATATLIDQLLLTRFAIARNQFPWTLLLEAAGFAEDGLRMSRGTLIRARDGHLCHSLREKAVCDFLHQSEVHHEREPLYPLDPDLNPAGRRRADWLLSDGTMVELWGLPKEPVYAAKMEAKRQLAERHGLRLIEITDAELPRLPEVFAAWIPVDAATVDGRTRWTWSPTRPDQAAPRPLESRKKAAGDNRGRNDFNTSGRRERLERARRAVQLQRDGRSRNEIATTLGVTPALVKQLLRDGKFYADPTSNPARAGMAAAAAAAREMRLTREQFQLRRKLSGPKAQEAWRDADVLHDMQDKPADYKGQ